MKLVVLVFSCLLALALPADANDTRTLNAMIALANRGDAEAQYHVGMMHNNGIGTPQDRSQAFAWFEKSAAANDPLGAYKLGCYYDGQGAGIVALDADQALKYKLVSAKAGYARAQHDVALMYDRQGNSEDALKWWKAAGDQGLPEALFSLARVYSAGKGTPRDMALSYAYFKLSKVAPAKNVNEMASMLSKPERDKADKFISEWKPQPTTLTLKALSGFTAAEEHLKAAKQVF